MLIGFIVWIVYSGGTGQWHPNVEISDELGSDVTVFQKCCLIQFSKFAQGLTWLLPERFSASEIGPEAGFVKLW
jgi:hypothetical protein